MIYMNLLEIRHQIVVIDEAVRRFPGDRAALYQKIEGELTAAGDKVVNANMMWLFRKCSNMQLDQQSPLLALQQKALSLTSYNQANVFVWLKRYLRLETQYMRLNKCIANELEAMNQQLYQLNEELKHVQSSNAKTKVKNYMKTVRANLCIERISLDEPRCYQLPNNITWLELLMNREFSMSKHTALQLLSVDHDSSYVNEVLTELPDVLSYNDFEDLVFVHKVESDDLFFKLYFKRFKDAIESNDELRDEMLNAIEDITGPIAKYDAIIRNGQVASVKRVKPKLTLIKKE